MAIWQKPYLIAPRIWLESNAHTLEEFLGDDGWDLKGAWNNFDKIDEIANHMDSYFVKENMMTGWFRWKATEHDSDFDIFLENNQIETVQCRLDKRAIGHSMSQFATIVAELCKKWDLQLLDMRQGSIKSADEFKNSYSCKI